MTAAAWFSCIGMPLASGDLAEIAELLRVSPAPSRVEIRGLAHWHEVGTIIRAATGAALTAVHQSALAGLAGEAWTHQA